MRRIYIESIIGILVCFLGGVMAYEMAVFQLTTDYEYLLEDYEATAHQELIQRIADTQGFDGALNAMSQFADTSRQKLKTFPNMASVPEFVREYFRVNIEMNIYFDDDRDMWLRLANIEPIFLYTPDEDTLIRQKVDLESSLMWVFFISSFVLYGVVHVLIIYRRVKKLEQATLSFALGDLSVRADTSSKNAIGSLNHSFNVMADRIRQLIESNRALTNAVAHELRTPIFRIQWQAELLKETNLNDHQNETVQSIVEDTEEMEQMVDELLCYTKLDTQYMELDRQSISSLMILESAASRWRKETQLDIAIVGGEQEARELFVDKKLLTRALDNIVRNAIKFAETKIIIEVGEREGVSFIDIHDDGPGIDEQHISQLFDPFYVGSKARNKAKSGHGLGLSIVKKICEQHEAQVEVGRSKKLNGALFTLSFPLCNKSSDNPIQ